MFDDQGYPVDVASRSLRLPKASQTLSLTVVHHSAMTLMACQKPAQEAGQAGCDLLIYLMDHRTRWSDLIGQHRDLHGASKTTARELQCGIGLGCCGKASSACGNASRLRNETQLRFTKQICTLKHLFLQQSHLHQESTHASDWCMDMVEDMSWGHCGRLLETYVHTAMEAATHPSCKAMKCWLRVTQNSCCAALHPGGMPTMDAIIVEQRIALSCRSHGFQIKHGKGRERRPNFLLVHEGCDETEMRCIDCAP